MILPAFLIVILLVALLKDLIKKAAAQTVLEGLKSCAIGIILATGVYMALNNCIGSLNAVSVDLAAIALTMGLAAVWFGAKKLWKKGISPILLICLAGAAGVLIYGWK